MKKSKLSITLVTSFIAAMALTACKDVTKSDKAIVTFKPYNGGEEVELLTDNVYNKYRGTSNGISMFYDKILEVLIRYEFKPVEDGGKGFNKGDMNYEQIENYAKNQVQEQKDKAKANAKSNKETSYKDEWQSILDSYKVEDEAGLKEHFIYEKEKEVMKNWYAGNKDKAEELKKEFIGIDENGNKVESKVAAAMPYHVRHILVKVDEASDSNAKFYKGTISEAQAKLLANTANALASGKYTFSEVAKLYSEDGSASSGGDVGIMTNAATGGSLGMVNEFQLGVYAYDSLIDDDNKVKDTDTDEVKATKNLIRNGLGITDEVAAEFANTLTKVPLSAFTKIGEYAEVTADKYGNKLANGSATLYPRNILWNKYLNLHNIFLITNDVAAGNKFKAADAEDEFKTLVTEGSADPAVDLTKNPRISTGVLCDERGNPIIGVRSQYGIHFMVIEKSMYDYKEVKDAEGNITNSTLADYYSTKLPDEEGYVENSYVGYIVSQSAEDYKTRSNDVKSKITSFDPTYDYRLYQWLTTEVGELQFSDNAAGLGDEIASYIGALQDNNLYKQKEGLKKVWRTYDELLDVQEYNRSVKFDITTVTGATQDNLTRLVSEAAANDFVALYNGNFVDDPATAEDESSDAYKQKVYAKFAEGGEYYYYA